MKYETKEAFEAANAFGTGEPNTAYARFFQGDSFLNPLTDPQERPVCSQRHLCAGLPQQLAHPPCRQGRRTAAAVYRR